MEVDLISERAFTARVGSVEIPGFRIVSEWEGFAKLEHPEKGVLIVTHPKSGFIADHLADIFADIFGKDKDLSRRVTIVKGTPALIAELQRGTIEKQRTPAPA